MKIIAFYLPQFHEIPENNEWWGKGFTEWTNVRKAKPLSQDHAQPRVPLNDNYYDLSNIKTLEWQVGLAKNYGIYAFSFYHYWFDGKLLLEKPMEMFLEHTELDLPFCICWANGHWSNQWVSASHKVLIEQRYGDERQWEEHFNYLLPFFKDKRYIKQGNKPIITIYQPDIIPCLNKMLDYWKTLAQRYGFDGLVYGWQAKRDEFMPGNDNSRFSYEIDEQPRFCIKTSKSVNMNRLKNMYHSIGNFVLEKTHHDFVRMLKMGLIKDGSKVDNGPKAYDYDETWQKIISTAPLNEQSAPGAFVDWDNTPRYGKRGFYFTGVTPEKFKKYLSAQIRNARDNYKSEYIWLFAWNEWGEGGYLEPDELRGYGMLEAVKAALEENGEFPDYEKLH